MYHDPLHTPLQSDIQPQHSRNTSGMMMPSECLLH